MSDWSGRKVYSLARNVVAAYGWRCWLCKQMIHPAAASRGDRLSVDHVIPRSMGGSHDLDNLRPAHQRCNSRRGARPAGRVHHRPAERPPAFFGDTPGKTRPHLSFSPNSQNKTPDTALISEDDEK